jgi:hypothetical protein
MNRQIRPLLLATLASLITGCAGGFDCPFDRPSCCDNVLFGCGPFDLPNGCSCSDYFLKSFSGFKLANQTPRQTLISAQGVLADTSGTWRTTGTKTNSKACPLLPASATSTLLIREENKKVSIKLLGYSTLRGNRVGDVVRVQGAYKMPPLGCEAFIKTELTPTSATNSPVTTTVDWKCKVPSRSCTVTYKGNAKRL